MRISVVTPSFNSVRFMEACLASVISQDYSGLEYIVMDGGSKDGTVDIIRRHERKIAYWVSAPDAGHYDAVNKGFARATGEILCFINSDDMLAPGSLATVAEIFTQFPEVAWITGVPGVWDEHDKMIEIAQPMPVYGRRYLMAGEHDARILPGVQQESCFWRKSLWEAVGGGIDVRWDLAGDFDLWTRMAKHAELVAVEKVLSGNRRHADQRSAIFKAEYFSQVDAISSALSCRTWLRSGLVQKLRRVLGGWRAYGILFPKRGAILTFDNQLRQWVKSTRAIL